MTETPGIRIDKWLWAARFFKTRSLAKKAVEGGKIHINDQRTKSSKEVFLNQAIRIRQGSIEKSIIVTGLSNRRGNATEAAKLYEETLESIEKRENEKALRKAFNASLPVSDQKPTKKQRRQIFKFIESKNN